MPLIPELNELRRGDLPRCPRCGGKPINRMDAYFHWQVICMGCRMATSKWRRSADSDLEWRQVICKKEV